MPDQIVDLDQFSKLVASLKGVGNTKTILTNDLISKFYVDLYPSNYSMSLMKHQETTILLGKKGTGKSTIINRFMDEISKDRKQLALYIDSKSLFTKFIAIDTSKQSVIDDYLFFQTLLDKLFETISENLSEHKFINSTARKEITNFFKNEKVTDHFFKDDDKQIQELKRSIEKEQIGATLGITDKGLSAAVSCGLNNDTIKEFIEEYSRKIIEYYSPSKKMEVVRKILQNNGIHNVFICFDDFSEISINLMSLIVDFFIAPLHNNANNFYKFKIASYPGRLYLGTSENGINEKGYTTLKLDFYERTKHLTSNEAIRSSIEHIKKLLDYRFDYYFDDTSFESIINPEKETEEYYKRLVSYTFNNPRLIGKILGFAHRISLINNKLISFETIDEASIEFFKEVKENFFINSYANYFSYLEKLSVVELKELYDLFFVKAKENHDRGYSRSKQQYGNIFYIDNKYSNYLQSFELGYLVFKLREEDNKGTKYSFYTMNCALCKDNGIVPKVEIGNYSIYFHNPEMFDYTNTIYDYIHNLKHFKCDTCSHTAQFSEEAKISDFGYKCKKCDNGHYELVSRSL